MERDFLGAMAMKEPRECSSRDDSVLLGSSVAQLSFSTNIPSLLPSMSTNTAGKYNQRRARVGQFSLSNSQPTRTGKGFRSKQKSLPFLHFFNVGRQGCDQYSVDFNPSHVTNTFDCSTHNQFLSQGCCANCHKPLAPNLYQKQSLGERIAVSSAAVDQTDDAFFPQKPLKSHESQSQLTLFYGGEVIVFEDISVDQVQEIMLLARSKPSAASSFADPESEVPVMEAINASDAMEGIMAQCESQGQEVSNFSGKPVSGDDMAVPKHAETSTVPLISVDMASPASVILRAIPQARKASLARFLEKRKARMINFMPYSYNKISLHITDGLSNNNSNEY